MSQAVQAFLAVALVIALILIAPLVGICVGAFAGYIVGLLFPGTVAIVGSAIAGGALIPAWQVGAILGFVGGFFKTRVFAKNDD